MTALARGRTLAAALCLLLAAGTSAVRADTAGGSRSVLEVPLAGPWLGYGTVTGLNDAGTAALVKYGPGTLTLDAPFLGDPGGITVLGGTLLVDNATGSGTGIGPVTIGAGALLEGTGTIGGPLILDGTLAPGEPGQIGALTLASDFTMASGSTLSDDLGVPGASDLIQVEGAVTLDGTLQINARPAFGAGSYDLIDNGGRGSFRVGTLKVEGPSGYRYQIRSQSGHVNLIVTAQKAPEPASIVLLPTGMLAVWYWCRRVTRRLST